MALFETVLSVGGSLLGGMMGADASKDAAKEAMRATQAGIEEQRRQYDINRSDLAPYRQVGQGALYSLADLLGIKSGTAPTMPTTAQYTSQVPAQQTNNRYFGGGGGIAVGGARSGIAPVQNRQPMQSQFNQTGYNTAMSDYQKALAAYNGQNPSGSLLKPFTGESLTTDPGYQFRLDQGYKVADRNLRRGGSTIGGNTLRALNEYGQNYASNEFNNAFTRDLQTKQNTYNMLSGVAGTGQTASTATAQLGSNSTNNISNLLQDVGNARGAGSIGSANAWSNAINNAGRTIMDQYTLDKILKS